MRTAYTLLLCLLLLIPSLLNAATRTTHPADEKIVNFVDGDIYEVVHPDWFLEHDFLDLQENLYTALENDKKGLMVFYTTTGCSYCALFIQESLGDLDIQQKLRARFDTIGLEIFDDAEMTSPNGDTLSVKEFAVKEKAHMAPTLIFYDDSGQQVFRAVGYQAPKRFSAMLDYVDQGLMSKMSFGAYVDQQETSEPSTPGYSKLKADPLFVTPPYALDRSHFAAQQPLLVIFEKPGCDACADYHKNVLSDPDIRKTMENFEVVRLDTEDSQTPVLTPDGRKTTPRKWFESTGMNNQPAFLYFNEEGQESLRIDAVVMQSRMTNSLNYMLERVYEKDWTYQRFARSQARKRMGLPAE